MDRYDPKAIEAKWQEYWAKEQVYKTTETSDKPKFYVLDMFPYPSGEGLHVGHPKGYIATDVVSRMKRMQGFNVLHPMGFDAFGLPAEQYAIKMKVNPAIAVEKNVARYKKQLEILGFDYDWSREVNTTDPKYYKWTQWIFLKLLEKGLAEERYEPINWCPVDKTGLANEDIEDGKCERCGAVVEKRLMKQWVLKITDYADRLLEDLDATDANGKPLLDWPESIKESQRNWIGRSEGAEFDFAIKGSEEKITIFTTRADTLFGVTYVVLAPEHPMVVELLKTISNKNEVQKYIESVKAKNEIERTDATKEKTGVELKGVTVINPANDEEVPVWIADYVLVDYGTGAVMAVPAHDERDFDFAMKYNLPVREVVAERFVDMSNPHQPDKELISRHAIIAVVHNPKNDTYLCLKWKKQPWTTFVMGGIENNEDPVEAAIREIREETGYKNIKLAKVLRRAQSEFFAAHKNVNRIAYTRNILFELENEEKEKIADEESEIHDIVWLTLDEIKKNGMTHSELPIILDGINKDDKSYGGEGVLVNSADFTDLTTSEARQKITTAFGRPIVKYKLRDWVFSRQRYWGEPIPVLHDENGAVVPLSEKDLPLELPPVEQYEPTDTGESPLANIPEWVEFERDGHHYKRETNTMPQWAGSSWYYLRYMDPNNDSQLVDPAREKYWNSVDLYVGGAEHATRHLIYARFWHKFLYDIGVVSTIEPFAKLQSVGLIMANDGRKMSKRWGNVVNPDEMVDTFGADSMRLYEMFMGPFDQAIAWNTNGVVGTRRFIEKVWKLCKDYNGSLGSKSPTDSDIETLLNKTIKKVTEDIAEMKFNTAVSSLMIFVNELDNGTLRPKTAIATLLKLLAPFAPHVTEELWYEFGNKTSIHLAPWPVFDPSKLEESTVSIAIQINGKTREVMTIQTDLSEDDSKAAALALPSVQKWIAGKEPRRVIWVKNRILNLIIDL